MVQVTYNYIKPVGSNGVILYKFQDRHHLIKGY